MNLLIEFVNHSKHIIKLLFNVNIDLNLNVWNIFVDIATIATPFIIYFWTKKATEKQDRKILEDNRVNRIANLQSILIFDKIEIILHTDSWQNYVEQKEYKNVLLSREHTNANSKNKYYGMEINFYLKNLTNVFPKDAFIDNVLIWDNTEDSRQQINSKQLRMFFKNINSYCEYKSVVLNQNNDTCISILCCMASEQLQQFTNYNKDDTKFSIKVNLSIRNLCGIIDDCVITGTFKVNEKKDISSGAIGGTKIKLEFDNKDAYLQILEVREENKNE